MLTENIKIFLKKCLWLKKYNVKLSHTETLDSTLDLPWKYAQSNDF